MNLEEWSKVELIKPGGPTERVTRRIGYLLGAGFAWLLIAAIPAAIVAWWLAQVLR